MNSSIYLSTIYLPWMPFLTYLFRLETGTTIQWSLHDTLVWTVNMVGKHVPSPSATIMGE